MLRLLSCFLPLVLGLLPQSIAAQAAASQVGDLPGDVYDIRLEREGATTKNDHSSGSSHDVWVLVERVIALRDSGIELEFDLPARVSVQERRQAWEFPTRVLLSPSGTLTLLNGADAEARLKSWLGDRAQNLCGHWVFGWTAQYVDCDPQSVLKVLEPYVRPGDLRDGAMYIERGARGPTHLRAVARRLNRTTLVAEMEIDPEAVRQRRAASDVAIAEMMHREPLALDDALAARAGERISGTLVVTFETDADGRATRRTSVSEIDITSRDGAHEHERSTQTTTWRLVSRTSR
ncbi:MAG: hypothetical protein GC190_08015 [Alphaproteobacteria bacterium]|nr:hypothetical protein [Alphaproteobacteria bacterium]